MVLCPLALVPDDGASGEPGGVDSSGELELPASFIANVCSARTS